MNIRDFIDQSASSIGARMFRCLQRASDQARERYIRKVCEAHNTAKFLPESAVFNLLHRRDSIRFGAYTVSRGECKIFHPSGKIEIGSHCYIGDHSKIWSAIGIRIGDRVLISHGVNVHDHDAHPFGPSERHEQAKEIFSGDETNMVGVAMSPIVIEDDVWIGFNAIILKGAKIGTRAIIGAATVITKDVPAGAIMVGNPARQIGMVADSVGDGCSTHER